MKLNFKNRTFFKKQLSSYAPSYPNITILILIIEINNITPTLFVLIMQHLHLFFEEERPMVSLLPSDPHVRDKKKLFFQNVDKSNKKLHF